jgi:hypothetical protein
MPAFGRQCAQLPYPSVWILSRVCLLIIWHSGISVLCRAMLPWWPSKRFDELIRSLHFRMGIGILSATLTTNTWTVSTKDRTDLEVSVTLPLATSAKRCESWLCNSLDASAESTAARGLNSLVSTHIHETYTRTYSQHTDRQTHVLLRTYLLI